MLQIMIIQQQHNYSLIMSNKRISYFFKVSLIRSLFFYFATDINYFIFMYYF